MEADTRMWGRAEIESGLCPDLRDAHAVLEPAEAFRETSGSVLLAVGPFAAVGDAVYPRRFEVLDLYIDNGLAGSVAVIGVYYGAADLDYLLFESVEDLVLPLEEAPDYRELSDTSALVARDHSAAVRRASVAVVVRLANEIVDAPESESELAVAHAVLASAPVLEARAGVAVVDDPLGAGSLDLLGAFLTDLGDWMVGGRLPRTRSALARLLRSFGRRT